MSSSFFFLPLLSLSYPTLPPILYAIKPLSPTVIYFFYTTFSILLLYFSLYFFISLYIVLSYNFLLFLYSLLFLIIFYPTIQPILIAILSILLIQSFYCFSFFFRSLILLYLLLFTPITILTYCYTSIPLLSLFLP